MPDTESLISSFQVEYKILETTETKCREFIRANQNYGNLENSGREIQRIHITSRIATEFKNF